MHALQTNAAGSSTAANLNVIQTLHQEQLARLASVSMPKLASQHSRTFLQMARTHIEGSHSLYEAQRLNSVRYRSALWAEAVEPTATKGNGRDEPVRVVPDFYHQHNPRCRRCAIPLIAGVNEVSRTSLIQRNHGRSKKRKSARVCLLCQETKQNTARQRQLRTSR